MANAVQSQRQNVYGGRFYGGSEGSGDVYGVHAETSNKGTGNRYGIYTQAPTMNPSPTTKSWALYSLGNNYFSGNVFIGSTTGVNGYKLSVDGKMICEEVKVQLSTDWPDYVFEKGLYVKIT